MSNEHEDAYEAQIDEIVDLVNARQPLPPDEARARLFQALDAIRWYRWARVTFVVPAEVGDGELRQWIGERLANGDLSIVRLGEDGGPVVDGVERSRQWPESITHVMVFSTSTGTVKTGGYESVLQAAIHAHAQGYTVLEIKTVEQAARERA